MDIAKITTKPKSILVINAARLSIASGVLFVILLGSLHLLEPEYDPTWSFISEYALGDFGWMMQLAFLLMATSLVSCVVSVFSQLRSILGYIGLAVLLISAVGLFISAMFNTDPITFSQDEYTFSGKMHVLGASLEYTPIAALLISIALARIEAWRIIRTRLMITSAIMLLLLIAFILFLPFDGKFGPGVYTGLVGRFMIVSYVPWLITIGYYILNKR
ncbi:MAG: DUF998 domain-containing protein [Candidatus Cohnella colombiensis]|uniref:DUF998 domain-containing protein n=1 Tax=Candidatus Cohnella colombiensis TaxID=3121368 RepID=A0AA95JBX9_9BACL|nr:MAG: DUF998 domain-containing protein [Cohnella sp.]